VVPGQRVGAGVARLRLTAADVAALGAQAQVEGRAALLAPFGGGSGEEVGRVRARGSVGGRVV